MPPTCVYIKGVLKVNKLVCSLGICGLIVALSGLVGCGPDSSADASKKAASMESLSREDVLVRLNGRGLTKGAWEDFSSLRLAFYKLMKPNEREENFRRVKQSTAAACLPYFIQNSILHDASDEYKKTHGDYSAADRASVRTWLEKKYVCRSSGPAR